MCQLGGPGGNPPRKILGFMLSEIVSGAIFTGEIERVRQLLLNPA